MAAEGVALRFQFRFQLSVIEDLAVEHNGETTSVIDEWLMTGSTYIDDAQASLAKRRTPDAEQSFIVGATVGDALQSRAHALFSDGLLRTDPERTDYAAHRV